MKKGLPNLLKNYSEIGSKNLILQTFGEIFQQETAQFP